MMLFLEKGMHHSERANLSLFEMYEEHIFLF